MMSVDGFGLATGSPVLYVPAMARRRKIPKSRKKVRVSKTGLPPKRQSRTQTNSGGKRQQTSAAHPKQSRAEFQRKVQAARNSLLGAIAMLDEIHPGAATLRPKDAAALYSRRAAHVRALISLSIKSIRNAETLVDTAFKTLPAGDLEHNKVVSVSARAKTGRVLPAQGNSKKPGSWSSGRHS